MNAGEFWSRNDEYTESSESSNLWKQAVRTLRTELLRLKKTKKQNNAIEIQSNSRDNRFQHTRS